MAGYRVEVLSREWDLAGDRQDIIKFMTGCEKTESHTLRP